MKAPFKLFLAGCLCVGFAMCKSADMLQPDYEVLRAFCTNASFRQVINKIDSVQRVLDVEEIFINPSAEEFQFYHQKRSLESPSVINAQISVLDESVAYGGEVRSRRGCYMWDSSSHRWGGFFPVKTVSQVLNRRLSYITLGSIVDLGFFKAEMQKAVQIGNIKEIMELSKSINVIENPSGVFEREESDNGRKVLYKYKIDNTTRTILEGIGVAGSNVVFRVENSLVDLKGFRLVLQRRCKVSDTGEVSEIKDGRFFGVGIAKTGSVLYVSKVFTNAPAWLSGVRVNDIILQINNRETSKMSLKDAINIIRDNESLVLLIQNTFANSRVVDIKTKIDFKTLQSLQLPASKNQLLDYWLASVGTALGRGGVS
ncbi:MAG: PDZ domain-containing protein [Pseudomonadota bacterium]